MVVKLRNHHILHAIPEEHQNGHIFLADESGKSEHGSNTSDRSDAQKTNRSRDDKIRAAKQLYEQERQRRIAELLEAQRLADEFRKKQEDERKRKIDDARRRDADRRREVEERRRRLEQAELERRESLLKKMSERDMRSEHSRSGRTGRAGIPFAFGSSTPREICETIPVRAHSAHPQCGSGGESAHMRSHRRAVSCAGRSPNPATPINSPTTETHHKQLNQAVKRSKSMGPEKQKETAKKIKPVDDQRLERLAAPRIVKKPTSPDRGQKPPPARMTQSMMEDKSKRLAQPKKVAKKPEDSAMTTSMTTLAPKKRTITKPETPAQAEPKAKKPENMHSSKLMATSMIELPTTKKTEAAPPVAPKEKPERKLSSPRPSNLQIPKSQSAQDLKTSSNTEEEKQVESVTVNQILPDVDPSEAKKKFDEQRRLHRERLEAEKRAEEERKQKEEEFRKKRIEEQKRRDEELKRLEEENRLRVEEERKKKEEEEVLRREEEERLQKEAEDKLKLKEELAKQEEEQARQEKLAAEEVARLERKKKLEAIMNRVKTNQNGPADKSPDRGSEDPLPSSMTTSMPPGFLSNSSSANDLASIATAPQEAPAASPALALLAGRLKGTKAAEILARHSASTQNLSGTPTPKSPEGSPALENSSPEHRVLPQEEPMEEDVDAPALLSSNIETRLAEVRARLHTTDNSQTELEQVINLQEKDENTESGVSSPGAHGPDSPSQFPDHPLPVL